MTARHSIAWLAIACCFAGNAARAQEAAPASAATDATGSVGAMVAPDMSAATEGQQGQIEPNKNRFVEEVIVTAQKREENLQDVPISVQAFSADALDARGIEEPKALQLVTPGMSYSVFAGYSLIYIRGVGTDAFIPSADASVATYIDNIYYPFAHGLASSLGAIERVEVLKGPQGTLFGRNSTGGAINIVTKQPGATPETSVLVSRESYDKTNFRVYTNVPLTESLAISLSGLSYSEDPYYKLAASSPRTSLPRETSQAFSLKAGWRPIDDLHVTVGYSYINTRGSQAQSLPVGEPTPLGTLLQVRPQSDYVTSEDAHVFMNSMVHVANADIQYTAPWFDMRLIGSDQKINGPAVSDFDGSNMPLVTFESANQFANVRTAELQFLSNANSWGAQYLKWIAGLYYIDSSAGWDPIHFSVAPNLIQALSAPPSGGPLAILQTVTSPLLSVLSAIPGGGGLTQFLDRGAVFELQGILATKSEAAFFQATANFTDELALTLGGRYQVEKRRLDKATSKVAVAPDVLVPVPVDLQEGRSKNTSNFSPKVVLDYKFSDEKMAYVSYSQGFKSGTYNIIAIYAPGQYIKPEKTTSYEIGYKSTMFDHALRLNAAVFQNEIDNLQVQTISLTSGGAVRFETAGSARIRGAEFDAIWEIARDTLPGLVLTASGAYLDGVYTDYKHGSGFDETSGIYFGGSGLVLGGGVLPGRDFTGNKTVRTPKLSGDAGLSYTLGLDDSSVELASDVYYNSGSYFSAQNRASSKENSYYVVNARISYAYDPWGVRVTAFGKNLNQARYHYVIADLDFGTAKLLAPPATYGVKLQWDF